MTSVSNDRACQLVDNLVRSEQALLDQRTNLGLLAATIAGSIFGTCCCTWKCCPLVLLGGFAFRSFKPVMDKIDDELEKFGNELVEEINSGDREPLGPWPQKVFSQTLVTRVKKDVKDVECDAVICLIFRSFPRGESSVPLNEPLSRYLGNKLFVAILFDVTNPLGLNNPFPQVLIKAIQLVANQTIRRVAIALPDFRMPMQRDQQLEKLKMVLNTKFSNLFDQVYLVSPVKK